MSDVAGLAMGGADAGGQARAGGARVRRPPPGREWRRRTLAVPGLVLLGVLLLVGAALLQDRRGKRADELCHQLAVPWTLFALVYAALVCGVAALVVCGLLFRASRRAGLRGVDSWQGSLALVISVPGVLAVLFEATAVYAVHSQAGAGYWQCASAGALPGIRGLAAALPL
ncbi:hypothetical protein [Actinacidiphila bryophytorum]|uniref:Uncharacterized protein n=2 Tax=Actinacidiphila bryophytorum TaxID=1436133 RepID=A0A9W4H0B5_9ACTN|nr:hypothetical protein [Actinacidiphila bryophytorum]MBM9440399.1 hypothetical protein [Actinacidiphila bryophytorum]CAG7636776.1 conserved membrane hypothetical protein [Actinacidiphila bryophytorum]